MEAIGVLHGRYGLCSVENGLAVLDLTACRKRIRYEEICRRRTEETMVPLLVPVSVECGADIVGRIDELNAYTRDLNIVFEPFGSDTVLVRELPETLKDTETSVFLQDLVDRFRQDEPGRPAGRQNRLRQRRLRAPQAAAPMR